MNTCIVGMLAIAFALAACHVGPTSHHMVDPRAFTKYVTDCKWFPSHYVTIKASLSDLTDLDI